MSVSERDALRVLSPADEVRARRLHEQAVVVDGCQTITFDQQFVDDLAAGGVTAIVATAAAADIVATPAPDSAPVTISHNDRTAREGMLALQRIRNWAASARAVIATSTADIVRAKADGRPAIVLEFQHEGFIEDRLELLAAFHALGLRVFQLTYNQRGLLGDGCLEPANGGLSLLGRRAVLELNRLGILIDLSHGGDRTVMETLELSERPVVFTHANPRAVSDTPRGRSDEAIRALARRGGVMGICFWAPITATAPNVRPTVDDVLKHIDYVVNLVGIEHVAIGSDWNLKNTRNDAERMRMAQLFLDKYPEMRRYGSVGREPIGLDYTPELLNLTRGLVSRGYQDSDILKILGDNWLRVMREAWGA